MVTIALKSQYVSLIITATSFVAEVLFVTSLRKGGSFWEHQRFVKGKAVNVRSHRMRSSLMGAASVALFFALEVVVSFVTDPETLDREQVGDCISLDIVSNAAGPEAQFLEVDFIERHCESLQNTSVLQHVGNFSEANGRVMCSTDAAYTYELIDEPAVLTNPGSGAQVGCVRDAPCVIIFQRDGFTYLSQTMTREVSSKVLSGTYESAVGYLKTELLFDSTGLLQQFAVRAAEAFEQNVNDPSELRRHTFLGSERSTCSFVSSTIDATLVPAFLIYVLSATWISSAALFLATALISRKTIFDLDDPLIWALHSEKMEGERIERHPVLSYVAGKDRHAFLIRERDL